MKILTSLFGFIRNLFFPYRGKIQTFTYYIPSPPMRNTGYREKQFDKVAFNFLNLGWKVLSIKTIPNPNPGHSGFWVLMLVQSTSKNNDQLDLNDLVDEDNLVGQFSAPTNTEIYYGDGPESNFDSFANKIKDNEPK